MSLWINGEWRPGRGPGFSKQDPVNLKVVWQGEAADAGQVAEAVAAARQAFPSWARLPFAARQAIVEKFAALLEASKAELTAVIGAETGKPLLGGGRGSDGDDQQGGDLGEGLPRPHRRTAQRPARRRRHAASPAARRTGGVWPL